MAERFIRLSIAPATETHCEDEQRRCSHLDPTWPRCDALGGEPDYDSDATKYKRLPECIAAEVRS